MAAQIASGQMSSVELTQAHLDRIASVDTDVHAFLFVDSQGALAQAAVVDAKRAAGEKLSPLAGVPLALKDVMVQKGVPTTAGSKILEGWRPPYDSTVVVNLKKNDIVILGKTNMDEFAMGSSTENSAYGPTHNPWDLTRIPGGSGGGSSAALAAFEAPLAIGTDTGGSIRQPAAVTGTVGVKPTYGGVSRFGLIAFSSSLDQAGPCARTVLDAALLHEAIAWVVCLKVAQLLLQARQLAVTCHLADSFTPFPLQNASAEAWSSVGTERCGQIESAQGNRKCVRLY